MEVKVRQGFGVSVVLASQGYPGSYAKGKEITVGQLPAGKLHAPSCCHSAIY